MQIKNRTIREARSPLPAEFPNIIGPIIVFIYRGTLYPTYYPRKSKLRSRTSPLYSRLSLFLRVEPCTSVMGGLTSWARDQTKVNDRFEPVFTHPHSPLPFLLLSLVRSAPDVRARRFHRNHFPCFLRLMGLIGEEAPRGKSINGIMIDRK